jgi:mannosyltransferase OCH1-like enzyme
MNNEYNFYIYDENECSEFMKIYFAGRVFDCYNILVPGAFKADLWRYCILYLYGGVYIDAGLKCNIPFRDIIKNYESVWVKDIKNMGIYNAFMYTKPKNPLLLEVINSVCDRVEKRERGKNCLDVTGPYIFGEAFKRIYNVNSIPFGQFKNMYFCYLSKKPNGVINHNNEIVIIPKRRIKYNKEMEYLTRSLKNKNIKSISVHYGYLYYNNAIYIDDPAYIKMLK